MPDFPPDDPSDSRPNSLGSSMPMDWKSAILDLISARSELILLELAEFRRQSARRAAMLVISVLSAASGWLLLLAGAIPLLAQAFGISWPIMALILAAIHIVLVGVLLSLARRNSGPAFPATFSEFKKDREWIENLTKTPKS